MAYSGYPSEPTVYTGTAVPMNVTTLLTHTTQKYIPKLRMSAFSATPFLRMLALQAWGSKAALGDARYGNVTKTSGKGIVFNQGGYQTSSAFFTTSTSGSLVGRMAEINPTFLQPGSSVAYSWVRYVLSLGIPEEFIKDNVGSARLLDRLKTDLKIGQASAVTDLSYMALGHSSAPTGSPFGLTKLVSVTQSSAVNPGGIDPSSVTAWANCFTPVTSVGGGGELDRPLSLLRKMESFRIRLRSFAESSGDYVLVGTPGAFQYYLRAAYADGVANQGLRNQGMYDSSIDHAVFGGSPFMYDGNVTVPEGATASTDAIYFLDLNELGLNIKANEYFEQEGWTAPATKDRQRFYQANLWLRMVPFVTLRRIQGVLYNLPANPDVITSNG